MHNRLYKFLNDNNIIYPLQYGFQQKYCTPFALINLTKTIKETLDEGNMVVVFLFICKKSLTLLIITF